MHGVDPGKAPDWYSVLKIGPESTITEITAAVDRMSRQASALANTSPHRSQELREVIRSIKRDLLASPESRRDYDLARSRRMSAPPVSPPPPPPPLGPPPPLPPAPPPPYHPAAYRAVPPRAPGPGPATSAGGAGDARNAGAVPRASGSGLGTRIMRFLQNGWTCPACGQEAMPNERFCKACGAGLRPTAAASAGAQEGTCAACGNAMSPAENFCTGCGARRR
jgi:Double zinc ribbon